MRTRMHGVTLMELMVVLMIVSVLLGLSFAGLQAWKRRAAAETCLAEVALRLREARNFAVSGSVGSIVDVDTIRSTLTSFSYVPVALVSLDRESAEASLRGVTTEPGRLGLAANLKTGEIVFANASALVGANGAALRFCLCMDAAPPERTVWTLVAGGEFLALQVTSNLALVVKAGPWTGTTRGRVVSPGRWHDVVLKWKRGGEQDEELVLEVDAVELRLAGPERTAPSDPGTSPFGPGIKLGPVNALLDEIELFALVESPEYGIPAEFVLVGPRARVCFAASGGLDLRRHDAPVAITIADAEEVEASIGKARTIVKAELQARGSARVWVELSGRIWSERLEPREEEAPPAGIAGEKQDAGPAAKAKTEAPKKEPAKTEAPKRTKPRKDSISEKEAADAK